MRGSKKSHVQGQKTSMAAMQTFHRLPIFLLTGGTKDSRDDCVRRLMAELTQQSLSGVFLRQGDGFTPFALTVLVRRYDLVIVNSGIDAPELPITLSSFSGVEACDSSWFLGYSEGWSGFVSGLLEKLNDCVHRTPVWGCVLIGGKSSRMGQPKHLIKDHKGKTWLENAITTLEPLLDGIVVAGAGLLPDTLSGVQRLTDIPGVVGPMAGILAAGRWQPLVSWLLLACDMPHVTADAANWLLADRRPGSWGRVPKYSGNERFEPFLAWYDFRSMLLFEEQVYSGNMRIGEAAGDSRIDHPLIPEALCYAWENVNTPEELKAVERCTEK